MRGRSKRKDKIDRLYDSFTVKDLSRAEFRKQYTALMNPAGLRRDLRRMVMDRQGVQTVNVLAGERKKEIDEAMKVRQV